MKVILDTNVFVAAGFNRGSASARIVAQVRSGELAMVWNEETRRETRTVLTRIPPLSWNAVAELFREEDCYRGETAPGNHRYVPDPADRKFAALAEASGALLITNDAHLLDQRPKAGIQILTPEEYVKWR